MEVVDRRREATRPCGRTRPPHARHGSQPSRKARRCPLAQDRDRVRSREFVRRGARYRQWILHNARLAEWNGSDLFCIGNELREMTRYEAEWRDLIATVRRIYHGPIT